MFQAEIKLTETLARALCQSCAAELVETHISWLVLGKETVYKLKKPVDFGFLDFSSLDKRRHACDEELRLNRRTAPEIYEAVVPISGSESSPRIGDDDNVIDYAVRMRRFDDSKLLDRLARSGALDAQVMVALADAIAEFHAGIHGTEPPADCGTPELVRTQADENFESLAELVHGDSDRAVLNELLQWTTQQAKQRLPDLRSRLAQGFVRECHGDLHLGNIYYADGRAVLFDCVEFSVPLRWIDVASDIAFTVMDLINHDLSVLAYRLLNEYLARSGDYGALRVLHWYLVYRAIVRAKVAAIRADQDRAHEGELQREYSHYLALARSLTAPRHPAIIIMCGFSGTGKTTVARQLAGELEAIHLRSDVERKRLFGLGMNDSSHGHGLDIYTAEASERTFNRLTELATAVVGCDLPVIVDATFIGAALRRRFTDLAEQLGVPWVIAWCTAEEEQIRERLAGRSGDASEAGLQQYLDQRANFDEFTATEQQQLVVADADTSASELAAQIRSKNGKNGVGEIKI